MEKQKEKEKEKEQQKLERPKWIKVKAPQGETFEKLNEMMKSKALHTVCEEASCPNMGDCWRKKHASFLILGDTCTRACAFCHINTGNPKKIVDEDEPKRVGESVAKMDLNHVVITSVDRDDLDDGGAMHFQKVIREIRKLSPKTTVEILTPDFRNKPADLTVELLVKEKPDVFNHNIETVPRLFPTICPGSRYFTSLKLLSDVKKLDSNIFTKSGIMVGLGESLEEVIQVMDDLRSAEVDFLTIGQYLQPTKNHALIDRYVTPEEFKQMEIVAKAKGFKVVSSSPLTRSSYHADEFFKELQLHSK